MSDNKTIADILSESTKFPKVDPEIFKLSWALEEDIRALFAKNNDIKIWPQSFLAIKEKDGGYSHVDDRTMYKAMTLLQEQGKIRPVYELARQRDKNVTVWTGSQKLFEDKAKEHPIAINADGSFYQPSLWGDKAMVLFVFFLVTKEWKRALLNPPRT